MVHFKAVPFCITKKIHTTHFDKAVHILKSEIKPDGYSSTRAFTALALGLEVLLELRNDKL